MPVAIPSKTLLGLCHKSKAKKEAASVPVYFPPSHCYKQNVLNETAAWKALKGPGLFLIAGPCVIEDERLCVRVATALKRACDSLGIFYIFKASYDKANRTSGKSFRGPGLENGLMVLQKIRKTLDVPVL